MKEGREAAEVLRGKRVLIVIENLPAPFDRRVWQEAETLRDAGMTVSIVCPAGPGCEALYEEIDGIAIHRFLMPIEARGAAAYPIEYAWALTWQFALSLKVFFGRGFDVLHACNPPDDIWLIGALFKRLAGRRFVFDHHDINPELYEAKFGRRDAYYRLLCWLERKSFQAADLVISTNESYREIALARGGVAPQKVVVVRSGPSLERMRIGPPDPDLKQGRKYLVGYVGVMGAQEGLPFLLEAARIIVHDREREDVQFGLVGGGPELAALKAWAAKLGVAEHVTFTGRVPDDEMLAMLNTADVCVNPDVANPMNDKSTMNKIMEYMALAKPVVQFDLTEGRVSAGAASLYAKPNDAADLAAKILELLDDPGRRAAMGAEGRRRVEQELAWPHEAPKLLEGYARLWSEGEAG